MTEDNGVTGGPPLRSVPVDWEALEDAFENNAPEVHSYLHLSTGEVLRIVDGVADPQMHARIAADANYLRIDPVSSREQYRWMERYIPMVEDVELRAKLAVSIDGKGAFRRFKDVLMSYSTERERWFAFRSERLRIFMEAWLNAHALRAVPRPIIVEVPPAPPEAESALPADVSVTTPLETREVKKSKSSDALRKNLREVAESLGVRDLEALTAFAEFLKSRRAPRVIAQQETDERGSDEEPVRERARSEDRKEPAEKAAASARVSESEPRL
jgi:Uncharacterised protein family (UPF0158)